MKFNHSLYKGYQLPLKNTYSDRFTQLNQQELIVTFQLNKKLPLYSWFKYKQGFSKTLVEYVLSKLRIPSTASVYDPFLGSGTTALAANALGYKAYGNDLLPLLVFVSHAKLGALCVTKKELKDAAIQLEISIRNSNGNVPENWPAIQLVAKAIPKETQNEIYRVKNIIKKMPLREEVKNILQLALINSIERCSYLKKDGGFPRLVSAKKVESVRDALFSELNGFILDLSELPTLNRNYSKLIQDIFIGDARSVKIESNTIDITITSPPYLNKTDYTRIYSLELAFDFVASFDELRDLRYRSFSSHVEAKRQFPSLTLPEGISSKIDQLRQSNLNNIRNPDMAQGYYEDLYYSLKENFRITKKGGRSCWVVWNSRLSGIEFEVDSDLAILAEMVGFEIEEIECVRLTGTSSQQVRLYGEVPLRESIVYLRKLKD